jgi:predicted aspartyl protease
MQLALKYDLPFVRVTISYNGNILEIPDVLIDTGSATTILSTDIVASVQILPLPQDTLYTIRGVGGSEVVFSRQVDYLKIGECSIAGFEIEVGFMDYGFEINGILGMDILSRAGAIINLKEMRIDFC